MENPKIRFKGFTKDWEQRKLRECAEFNPKSELPDVFEYIDLESVVGTNILSHRTESKSSAPSRAQRLAQKGDVFYQTVRPYQKNNCIFEKNDNNWVFSTGYAQLRPVNDSYFLLTLLQNEDFVKLVLDRCTGTSYPAINSNDLADIDVNVPSDSKEQQQIGTYFKQLDHLITLHQRKCEQTKKLKKYMLQKMFPRNGAKVPEIRFYGFTYDWEQRKLGEVCSRVQGNDGRMDLPTLTISAANGWMNQEDRFSGNIAGKEQENYTLLHKGELSYNHGNSKLAKYGTVFSLQSYKEALVPRVYHSFKVEEGSPDFLEYYFATKLPDRELGKLISSGARMDGLLNIGYNEFMGIQMLFPSVEEQKQISNYFRNLDTLITLHQRQHKLHLNMLL